MPQALYTSALALKLAIKNAPDMQCPWPPTGSDLTTKAAEDMVPTELFNFLAWTTGASDDPQLGAFVCVSDMVKKKLLSIAQDILYLTSSGKKQTPKHLALGMTVRHLTGSAKLTSLLNGLGHSVSQSVVLQHDTDLALKQLNSKSPIPEGFHKQLFTTLVWDNNDFGEETLSGAGTTHCTNGIILQWTSDKSSIPVSSTSNTTKKGRKRTLNPPQSCTVPYKIVKKCGPKYMNQIDEMEEQQLSSCAKLYSQIDSAFY